MDSEYHTPENGMSPQEKKKYSPHTEWWSSQNARIDHPSPSVDPQLQIDIETSQAWSDTYDGYGTPYNTVSPSTSRAPGEHLRANEADQSPSNNHHHGKFSIRSVKYPELYECQPEQSGFDFGHSSTEQPELHHGTSASSVNQHVQQTQAFDPMAMERLQDVTNEIKREAQNVQPLLLRENSIATVPDPELSGDFDQSASSATIGPGLHDTEATDEELDISILNSLPTPGASAFAQGNSHLQYGHANEGFVTPSLQQQQSSQLGASDFDNRYFGLDSIQTLAPPVMGSRRGTHSPQQSNSSNSEGSLRSGESILSADSPRMHPTRPRSAIQSQRASKKQSYYDFGNSSSAGSMINLNLADAVSKQQNETGAHYLLPRMKTIELYRKNARKSNDPDLEFQLAQYMMQTALIASRQQQEEASKGHSRKSSINQTGDSSTGDATKPVSSPSLGPSKSTDLLSGKKKSEDATTDVSKIASNLLKDAVSSLKRLSERGYADAQYLLGDIYSSTAINSTPDMEKSFKYFAMAGKHGHAEAAYRAALCLQEGWGTSRDARRALQFYKNAAVRNQPGALYQLGMAYFYGGMGLPDNSANRQAGVKWLSRAVNNSDTTYNRAPYELAKIFEVGYKDLVLPDDVYAAKLYSRAAELGFIPAAARLGKAYEFGELGCPQDPSLSIHYYTIAALGNDPNAQLSMCAWYMVGAGPSFPVNRDEAYEWCLRAALNKLPKAQYTLGFFYENGYGTQRDIIEAGKWYRKAAANGYEKAQKRIREMGMTDDNKTKGKCLLM